MSEALLLSDVDAEEVAQLPLADTDAIVELDEEEEEDEGVTEIMATKVAMRDIRPIFKNPDGSIKWSGGQTSYPDGRIEYRTSTGKMYVSFPGDKKPRPMADPKKETEKETKIHKFKDMNGVERPYVYQGGRLVEVPLPNQGTPKATSYASEKTFRIVQSVDELEKKVSDWTVGLKGSALKWVPETSARDFNAELDTLKSNIAFGELAEMRAASKTGGALGQVSNIELGLLQSALGALDTGQSPENFRKQLARIKASIQRWENAKAAYNEEMGGVAPTPTPGPSPAPTSTPPPVPEPDKKGFTEKVLAGPSTPSTTKDGVPMARPEEGKDEFGFTVGEFRRDKKTGKIARYLGNGDWQELP